MADLGTLGGASYGMGINDGGDVVGASILSSGYLHAFLWTGGAMTDLGTLGGTASFAYGINSSGNAVGCSFIPDSETTHAFLWKGGGLLDLNNLIPANSGWVLNEAYGINDNGQIAGMGMYGGQSHAFLLGPQVFGFTAARALTPAAVPEPGTLSMLCIGLILVAAGAKGIAKSKKNTSAQS